LQHPYLPEEEGANTITVTKIGTSKTYTPSADPEVIQLGPRSYFEGRFYINRTKLSGNIKVEYSYYNPSMIIKDVYTVFSIKGDRKTTSGTWPVNMVPGSEVVYLSSNDAEISENTDDVACYDDWNENDLYPNRTRDKESYCPNSFDVSEFADSYYYIDDTIDLESKQIKFQEIVDSEYQYVKMRYDVAPPRITSNQKFTKTALGIDAHYKPVEDLFFDMEYAKTVSDLSSNYTAESEELIVDVVSSDWTQEDNGLRCQYIVDQVDFSNPENSDISLVCLLSHNNIHGDVEIKFQYCQRENNDPRSKCLVDSNGNTIYQNVEYTLTSQQDYITVNNTDGEITLKRHRSVAIDENGNRSYVDLDYFGQFPGDGDRLILSYLYEKSVDQLVEGHALKMTADYSNKWMALTLQKDSIDPFYDQSFKGRLIEQGHTPTTDKTSTSLDLTFSKKVKGNFKWDSSEQKKLEGFSVSSTTSRDTSNYKLSYGNNSRKSHLKTFTWSRITTDSLGTSNASPVRNRNLSTQYHFKLDVKKNVLDFKGDYKTIEIEDATTPANNKETITKSLVTNYNPFQKLSLNLNFDRTNSSKGKKTRSNKYKVTAGPFPYIKKIDMNFDRVTDRENELQDPQITEDNAYTVNLYPLYRFRDITFNLTQNKKPPFGNRAYFEKANTKTFSFTLLLLKNLDWKPNWTRKVNQTQTWQLNNTFKWVLKFKPSKSRKNLEISWQQDQNETTSASLLDPEEVENPTVTSNDKDIYKISLKPSKRTSFSTTFTQTAGTSDPYDLLQIKYNFPPSRNSTLRTTYEQKMSDSSPHKQYEFKYAYKYTQKLDVNAEFTRNESGSGQNNTRTISYNFGADYKINPKTDFSFTYKEKKREGPVQQSSFQRVPNLTARLESRF